MKSNRIFPVVALAALVFASAGNCQEPTGRHVSPAAARVDGWNIICGITITAAVNAANISEEQKTRLLNEQYVIDASILSGIGKFYAAVALLQRVNVSGIKSSGKADRESLARIAEAQELLTAAKVLFDRAGRDGIALIQRVKTLPSHGRESPDQRYAESTLEEVKKLSSHLAVITKSLQNNTLPTVKSFHESMESIQKITQNGVAISKMHLGMQGHAEHINEELRFSR